MKIGTKSILFGAHQFIIHPVFVAYSWWKLYGFPFDPRLWISFFIHDWGYWGKPNMDGNEGMLHPLWAAAKMHEWFGKEWGEFCFYHSRHLASLQNKRHSRLCVADKLSIAMEPWWLYLPRVILTGEIDEYMGTFNYGTNSKIKWFRKAQRFCDLWAYDHRNLGYDKYTDGRSINKMWGTK